MNYMNFREFAQKRESLLSEISELSSSITLDQASHRTTNAISPEFGTILSFTSDWDLNSQKMSQARSEEDTLGWSVHLAPDMIGNDNSRVDQSRENFAAKIPQLAQQMAAGIGTFIQQKSPGTLEFGPMYSELSGLSKWGIDESLIPRFKIMLEKSIKLSVTNANSAGAESGQQPYAMMGTQIVRKDAHTQKGLGRKNYVGNMQKSIGNHANNMAMTQDARQQGRQDVMQRHGEIEDLWGASAAQKRTVGSPPIKQDPQPQQAQDDDEFSQFAHIGSPVGPPQQHQRQTSQKPKRNWRNIFGSGK